MKKISLLLICLLAFASTAFSTPISCLTTDATANGATADSCYGDDAVGDNPLSEAGFINTQAGTLADPFVYVAKYDKDDGPANDGMAGWTLTVTPLEDQPYSFSYSLIAPQAYSGQTVSFALGVKQANNSFVAYIFDAVTLNIDGFYNSTWLNPRGKEVVDYSHVTAFIQGGTTPVPEPSTLLLLGGGLIGLAWFARKK